MASREDSNVEPERKRLGIEDDIEKFPIHEEGRRPSNDPLGRGPNLGEQFPGGMLPLLPEGDFHVVPEAVADHEEREAPDGEKSDVSKVRRLFEVLIVWNKR